jgi:hypothetical protein
MQNKAKLITSANFEAERLKVAPVVCMLKPLKGHIIGYQTSNATQKGKEVDINPTGQKSWTRLGKP